MIAITIALTVALVLGFFYYTRPTPMEKDIKKRGGVFDCFRCKRKLNMSNMKCSHCGLITIFGERKKKYKHYFVILVMYLFAIANLWRKNSGLF